MLQRFHDRVGTAGLIVAIVAMVVALSGGAYAASGGLTSKQKKEVTKIAQTEAKKFAGKPGPQGPQGNQGSNGSNGAKGDTGPEGKQGPEGPQGKPGLEGEEGEAGSPWTVDGLPSGATEMGSWSAGKVSAVTDPLYAPISFAVPLKAGETVEVVFVNFLGKEEKESSQNEPSTICTGTFKVPTAPAGVLCVYEQSASLNEDSTEPTARFETASGTGVATGSANGKAGISGANLQFNMTEAETSARGVWAVTAP
jgi:hypothetical protein